MENNILPFRSRNTSDLVNPKSPWDTNASVAELISPNLDPWLYMIQTSLKKGHDIFNPDFYRILLKYKTLKILLSGDILNRDAVVEVIHPETQEKFSVSIENMLILWGIPVDLIQESDFKWYITNLLDIAGIAYTIWAISTERHITIKDIWEFNPNTIKVAIWKKDEWDIYHSVCPDGEDVDDLLDVNSSDFKNPIEIPLLYMMVRYAHLLKKYWYYPLQNSELLIYKYKEDDSSSVIHMTYAEFYEIIRKSIHEKYLIMHLNHKSTEEIIEKIYEKYVASCMIYSDEDDRYLT